MRLTRALVLAAGLCGAAAGSQASSSDASRFCDRESPLSAPQQDRLLRFAAIVRQELDASGHSVALVARSGLDLARFGLRYSHAGVSLKASANGPWSVRQLYYACDEARPRLYDQGMAGFLFGTDDPSIGFVSIVLLPPPEAAALERTALDKALALRLLAGRYSANAHPYSLRFQNCNQWVMELLATAWGATDRVNATDIAGDADGPRERAQRWLMAQGYAPRPVQVGSQALMFAANFIPWVHVADHPEEDRFALQFRTSTPGSIEAFVRERVPGAERIELCHDERQVVIRRGWEPLADGCRRGDGDRVVTFD
ncbi:MAG: DUF2145 domain-containing protein [Methylibium sp.]|uniref:DUF2145 domain-containing protein n=1 Tax=Methylibium sp. TaxID=2067992 RepID=UPI0017B4D913|nr:DUF2145 domain-containing protein [Methylibium sp.]MBA3599238.1 DUF2145 domain-containing protein [Methylibium sp.]